MMYAKKEGITVKEKTSQLLKEFFGKNPEIDENPVNNAIDMLLECNKNGSVILTCGNGGSAADAEHIVGELMKGFLLKRPINQELRERLKEIDKEKGDYLSDNMQVGIPAISLVSQTALATAFMNDVAPDMLFAQQVLGYSGVAGVLIGLSTSGNSKNIVYATQVAKALGIQTVSFTGQKESLLSEISDVCIRVPETETYKIQEIHIKVYHLICAAIEYELFDQ